MSGAEALRKLAEANMENASAYFKAQIDDLSEAAAEASSTFAMASAKELIEVCGPFVENLEQYLLQSWDAIGCMLLLSLLPRITESPRRSSR